MDLSRYDYNLPKELIANKPAEPRDSAKLFVYDTRTDQIHFDVFANLAQYLPPKSLLVFNDTKVLPARVFLKKETGGKVEVLLMINEAWDKGRIKGIVDRKIEVGRKLYFNEQFWLEVADQDENVFYFKPNFRQNELPLLLNRYGHTPLPKYIKDNDMTEAELRKRYQTVFAKKPASIAAPTASFHFTPAVLNDLKRAGHGHAFVTLHVGLGTFAPLSPENFKENRLHREFFQIREDERKKISDAKFSGRPVIAVGTTAMRTLESSAKFDAVTGETNLFIHPPYKFKIADAMITNFHVPKSSLMMLVQAFLEHKKAQSDLVDLYKVAIKHRFRFYSFGDAMLIV